MGQSTDAILFFGYTWDEENELKAAIADGTDAADAEDLPEWPEIIACQRGAKNPWDDYAPPDGLDWERRRVGGDEWTTANSERLDEWRAIKEAILAEFAGVDTSTHCSGDYPISYLYVWQMRVSRGYPQSIESLPVITDEQLAGLARWLEAFGVDAPDEAPRFWLASDWN